MRLLEARPPARRRNCSCVVKQRDMSMSRPLGSCTAMAARVESSPYLLSACRSRLRGRNPYDWAPCPTGRKLSTESETFRTWWATHNLRFYHSGRPDAIVVQSIGPRYVGDGGGGAQGLV